MEVSNVFQPAFFWERQVEGILREMKRNFWQDWEEFKKLYDITAYPPTTTAMAFAFWQYKKYERLMGYV